MTGTEFRQTHGDPTTWTDNEYEAFQAWAEPADQTPTTDPTNHDLAA
ncbi:hypothetical protein [Streptomyces griseosporeus]